MAIDIEHTDKGDKVTETPTTVKTSTDQITDASAVGKSVLKAADAAAARTAISAGTLSTVPDPTNTVVGGVKLGGAIAAPAAMTATADTASAATDVAGLLADHNDLVTKYNSLLTDTTALRTLLASVLAQLKAKTIPA
ncbi:hypothetical protein [Cedecea sp. NFIX57]|uniref:hypothetical protein n=1 Tax=Cedecea sp. NFIX57 TaxID=1566286 RepID=UPI000A0E9C6E|nr:hypothetical protein [Cedecea sp. NFIX57]SMG60168.1 hypothetical protein SAMN03159353_103414 [Cedecea sp. NFIX57]